MTTTQYIIFDTDMGSDDAWALQMILKAAKQNKNIKVIAITTVNGNTSTENAIKNTYRILDGVDRTDIPIYKGATEAFIPAEIKVGTFRGSNGFSDVEVWQPHYPNDLSALIQKENAVEIIRNLVMQHPHEISLLCVGPLTNIALAVKTYPEIRDKLKEAFIMGGNIKGISKDVRRAEFNFYTDPEAAHIVLNHLKCPITIVPLECREDSLAISLDWRFNVLANSDDKNVQLLNEVERISHREKTHFTPSDALLSAVFLFPDKCIKTKRKYNATVELHGFYTRGQMILDRKTSNYNVTVVEQLHENEFKIALQLAAAI